MEAEVIPISALRGDGVQEAFIHFLKTVRADIMSRSIQSYAEAKVKA
jgi:hypothetical protein